MEINRQQYDYLTQMFMLAASHEHAECELVFKSPFVPIQSTQFSRVLALLAHAGFKKDKEQSGESLDIMLPLEKGPLKNVRYHLHGLESIEQYCRDETLAFVPEHSIDRKILYFQNKAEIKPVLELPDYNIRVNLKLEEPVQGKLAKEVVKAIASKKVAKGYRMKQRHSFVDPSGVFRVDATVVRSNMNGTPSFVASRVSSQPEFFEIEMEYLVKDAKVKKAQVQEHIAAMCDVAANVALLLQDRPALVKQSVLNQVTLEYIRAASTLLKRREDPPETLDRRHFIKSKDYFVGPKPVSIEMEHLLSESEEQVRASIFKGYTVTEKADGDRYLAWVHTDGTIYLINDRLHVIPTGATCDACKGSILDGEYVTSDRNGDSIKLFMVFDAYLQKGKDISGLPLVVKDGPSRYRAMNEIVKAIQYTESTGQEPVTIQLKTFLAGSGKKMNKHCRDLLDKEARGSYAYHTDGLIFTPIEAPAPLGQTWAETFKWKPPQENTIDFMIEANRDVTRIHPLTGATCVLVTMYVGYRPYSDRLDGAAALTRQAESKMRDYVPREFAKGYWPLDASGVSIVAEKTGEAIRLAEIALGLIVECRCDLSAPDSFQWIPTKIRHDKTDVYRATKSISRTANDFNVVQATWKTIIHPITPEMLTDTKAVTRQDLPQDSMDMVYYQRKVKREDSKLNAMLDFHGLWVKERHLIRRFLQGGKSLFDIGMGMAGDLRKWIDAKASMVVGVDVSDNNITNPINGAYARWMESVKQKRLDPAQLPMLFLIMDAGKRWTPEYVQGLADPVNRDLAQIAFGLHEKAPGNPAVKPFYNAVGNGFDVVSCQFAIHYFFKDEPTLDQFCANLNDVIKRGGYFIGTCFDGSMVARKLDKLAKGESIQGRAADDGHLLWEIKKNYERYSFKDPKKNIGKTINNYIETINGFFDEYLVDFGLLRDKLGEYGIRLLTKKECKKMGLGGNVSSGTFEDMYREMKAVAEEGDDETAELAQRLVANMKDIHMEYSFLNRWFVFVKE
jgi:hypothetical protein